MQEVELIVFQEATEADCWQILFRDTAGKVFAVIIPKVRAKGMRLGDKYERTMIEAMKTRDAAPF